MVVSLSGWPALNNGGDEVVLQDATGAVIDRMRYESTTPVKDRAEVSYLLPSARATVNLWIFDRMGRRVKVLLNSESGGSRRAVWWEGTGDEGGVLKPGIYVVYMEATSPNRTYRKRVPVVLARGL